MRNSPYRLARRGRGTFYIFPALLPLTEVLPWVLSLIGALAGGSQIARDYMAVHQRLRRAIWVLTALSFLMAGGVYLWEKSRLPHSGDGSEITQAVDFPTVENFPLSPAAARPAKVYAPYARIWDVATDEQILGNFVLANDRLMVGTYKAALDIRSKWDGGLLQRLRKHHPIFMEPALADGRLYIGEGLHTADVSSLTAFDVARGQVVWDRRYQSHLESTPVIDLAHNRLFLAAGSLGVWSLNSETGAKNWVATLGHIDVKPLYIDGRLFAAAKLNADDRISGSALFELNPDTGRVLWMARVPGNPMGDVLAGPDDTIIVSTAVGQVGGSRDDDDGWVHAFSRDGRILWTYHLPAMPLPDGQILRDHSRVFFTLKDGRLIALDARTGHLAWGQKLGRGFNADCTLIDDAQNPLVVAVTTDGAVHVRQALTGELQGHMDVGEGAYTAPLYQDGVLYIANNYHIYAFAGPNGVSQ